jgi:hypothetical protein
VVINTVDKRLNKKVSCYVKTQKKTNSHPNKPDQSQTKRRKQDNLKVNVPLASPVKLELVHFRRREIWIVEVKPPIDVLDSNDESGVCQHPKPDKPRAEDLVLVVHCQFGRFRYLGGALRQGTLDSVVECGIDILLDLGGVLDNGSVRVRGLLRLDGRQYFCFVAALCAP